ncbi:MAG: YdcF family protein [Pseudomonadota bacterium]
MRMLAFGLLKLGFYALVCLLLAVLVTAIWFGRVAGALTEADAILVLGAGMSPEGVLDAATQTRVQAGVSLYEAGLAPVLLMSGGPAVSGGPAAGKEMAKLAVAAGVPEEAILTETRSTSTLQNARFSAPILQTLGLERVIVVTEGFHMARALLSLRWAGVRASGAHVSRIFRPGSAARMVMREALAWPFNMARVLLWHAGAWRGVPRERRDTWLR